MLIRKAKCEDSDLLSNLAYRSKAHWGYFEEFLQKCKDDLTVTKEYIIGLTTAAVFPDRKLPLMKVHVI
ncbi:hypothetical protein [Bacillus badius]|uniref:hypothetical protein n=1 Tax=Bacillus badius TaxID=1455 RepID=UPI001E4D8C0F|nr:hypothetical protein [Bacillus badius]